MASGEHFPIEKSDDDWRRELSPESYNVLRAHGTERAGTSPLNEEHRPGTFLCAGCDQELFSSATRFESGTGWPSFSEPLAGAVATQEDDSQLLSRTEVHCARCGGHLGHVFADGPQPSGERYCLNGAALKFVPQAAGGARLTP
jgi:peptide-methionine (R)-S-oxide reductase